MPAHVKIPAETNRPTDEDVRWFLDVATATWGLGKHLRRTLNDLLAEQGISEEDFLVLALLSGHPAGLSQIEVATTAGISTAQTSGLVERLKNRGWLVATRDPNDRRRQVWRLQPSGAEQLNTCQVSLRPLIASLQQCLTGMEPNSHPQTLRKMLIGLQGIPLPEAGQSPTPTTPSIRSVA